MRRGNRAQVCVPVEFIRHGVKSDFCLWSVRPARPGSLTKWARLSKIKGCRPMVALHDWLIDNRDEIVRMCEADSLIRRSQGRRGEFNLHF